MALSAKALEGYSIREALCTAIKFDGDGRMPKDGQVVGLSTCRWDSNYAPAAVVSSALRSEIPDDLRGAFTGDVGSLLLPLPRDLNRAAITQDNTGAQLVGNSLQSIVDALRPAPLLEDLGAQILSVSDGSAHVIGMGDGATVAWVSDGASAGTPSIGTTLGITSKARTLVSLTEVSHQILRQVTDQSEQLLLRDLMRGVNDGLEAAAFSGTGSSGQPTGVVNATGVNATTFAGSSPTRAELLSQMDDLANDDVDLTAVRWCVSPTMAVLLHSVVDAANRPIYDGQSMLGLPVHVSANVPSGKVLVGDWHQLVMPMWGRVEVSRSKSVRANFTERFRSIVLADIAIIRPSAFSVGSVS